MSRLVLKQKQCMRTQILHIYDQRSLNSISGIRATIFGATGFMGPYIGQKLGMIGSDLVFPHKNPHLYNDEVKELKLCAVSGMAFIQRGMDFDDLDMIDRVVKNSNVVINLVGPRKHSKFLHQHEAANIKVASRIADACQRNENVIRLIHMSALGQDQHSDSLDYRTKYFGEQEVRNRFNSATIFRPSTVFGPEDYFSRIFFDYYKHFYNYIPVPDDCMAKRQPIHVSDIALCVLNALKISNTKGQTFELGGPNVLTNLECYEILYNLMGREPKLVAVNKDFVLKIAQKVRNYEWFSMEQIVKHGIDNHVTLKEKDTKTIDDLFVKPVSFHYGADALVTDMKIRFNGEKTLDEY